MIDRTIATAADYADAMLTARRAKNWLVLLLLLMLLGQLALFFVLRHWPDMITNFKQAFVLKYLVAITDFLGIVLAAVLSMVLLLIVGIMLVGRLIGVARVTSAYICCLVLIALLIFHIIVPAPAVLAAFLLSFFFGYLVGFCLNFILNCIAFWTLETFAAQLIVRWASDLLSGQIIPLLFFPGIVGRLVFALPFAAIYSTPLLIYVGVIPPARWAIGMPSTSLPALHCFVSCCLPPSGRRPGRSPSKRGQSGTRRMRNGNAPKSPRRTAALGTASGGPRCPAGCRSANSACRRRGADMSSSRSKRGRSGASRTRRGNAPRWRRPTAAPGTASGRPRCRGRCRSARFAYCARISST